MVARLAKAAKDYSGDEVEKDIIQFDADANAHHVEEERLTFFAEAKKELK